MLAALCIVDISCAGSFFRLFAALSSAPCSVLIAMIVDKMFIWFLVVLLRKRRSSATLKLTHVHANQKLLF